MRCHSVFETHSSCPFFQGRWVATERTVNFPPLLRGCRCSGSAPTNPKQEVFFRLLRCCDFGKFPDAASFLAYLHTVARNGANDIRREAAWQTVDINEREAELRRTFPTRSSEECAATEDLFARVWQYLSADEKAVAGLTAEGHSMGEIAKELGLTANAVSVRWFRLRSRLRNLLKEQGIHSSEIK